MFVLLSIEPSYASAIMNGKKRYEFRRTIFKAKDVQRIYVYSTAPVKRIIGSFEVREIVKDTPRNLWSRFSKWSGMNSKDFFGYFASRNVGFAIGVESAQVFSTPIDPWTSFKRFAPPQSFCYLNNPLQSTDAS